LEALDDDLNISGALGHLFDWVRESNRGLDAGEVTPAEAAQMLADFAVLNSILALAPDPAAVPPEVQELVQQREAARAAKDWALSDRLRAAISGMGWQLKDTKLGPQLTRG
ncbi:MAG: cysteine--tRNA ligase, partial [Verrucomicrobia bacterium]|nr:cysteine--tRNA ligase [Verrucomicrobiota bacterium]